MVPPVPRKPIRFGRFELNIESGELWKQGIRVRLQEQPLLALVALLERPREVVSREELQHRLWPGDTFVDFDRGLNKAINRLREVLCDNADDPRFIETLPQRGYRFIADLEEAPPIPSVTVLAGVNASPTEPPQVGSQWPQLRRRQWLLVAGGLIGTPLIVTGIRRLRPAPPRIESIAVLPLENLSADPAEEYFSDGMTDELIGEIARIGSLRVTSRTSVMQYKKTRKPLREIARELNVDAIVEGTVVQSGKRVRITAQLIAAHDDRHLWSEKYERDLADILTVQSDVAREIATRVRIELAPQSQMGLRRSRRVNPEAYQAFLQGNYFLSRGIRGIGKSVEYFNRAIALDPSHADSHAGLAEASVYAGIFGLRPSAETYQEARVSAMKALALDDSNAGAHNALADVKKGYDWDLAGAETEYRRSLELNPSRLLTRLWYSDCLTRMKRHEEAIAESRRGLALDPVSPWSNNNYAMCLWRARRFDEAIEATRHVLDLDPNFINAFWWQGMSYAAKRDFPKAIAALAKGLKLDDGPLFHALLGHVYGRAGDRARAREALERLTVFKRQGFVSPIDFALVHAGLGDADAMFRWLEKAFEARATRIHELPAAYFDAFHSDPRYPALLKRVGLPA